MSRYSHDFNNPDFTAVVERIEHSGTFSEALVASQEIGTQITFYDEGDPPCVLEIDARVVAFEVGPFGDLFAICEPDWDTYRHAATSDGAK